jgi:predicted RNA binding protein YcfA (HicA-like mRNA interferase family)
MTKRGKLLAKIRNNPKQASFRDLRQLLESFGFELDHAAGSHHIFVGLVAGRKIRITIPFRRGILREVYVKDVLTLIEQIELDQEEEDESAKND